MFEEENKKEVVHYVSIFESNCTYKKYKDIPEEYDCFEIQFDPEYNIEIIFELTLPNEEDGTFVPFILDWHTKKTILTKEAQTKVGIKDDKRVNILDKELIVETGEKNILGFDFLYYTKIGFGFGENDVGLDISADENTHYGYNWLPDSFKELRSRIEDVLSIRQIKKNIEEVKKDIEELPSKIVEAKKNAPGMIAERKEYLNKLKEMLIEQEKNITNEKNIKQHNTEKDIKNLENTEKENEKKEENEDINAEKKQEQKTDL